MMDSLSNAISFFRLVDLPKELISLIAEHVNKKDLLSLRINGNRKILESIDFVFARACFTTRSLSTTPNGILGFENLTKSRFALIIRSIDIELRFKFPASITTRYLSSITAEAKPCKEAHTCMDSLYLSLAECFKRTAKLNHLIIRAPRLYSHKLMADLYHSIDFENLVDYGETFEDGQRRHVDESPLCHGHIKGYMSPRAIFHSIFVAIATARLTLKHFELLDFTRAPIRTLTAPTVSIFRSMAEHSRMQNLTSLTLEVDIFRTNGLRATSNLVKVLKLQASLKDLTLHLSPGCTSNVMITERMEACRPLEECLGVSPPFRLRSLELTGFCTSGPITLDRIIHAHSSSLRGLSLDETEFTWPNTMRGLFTTLSIADLEVFRMRSSIFNRNQRLTYSYYYELLCEDDLVCFDLECKQDASCKGWVYPLYEKVADDAWLWYDVSGNVNGQQHMKDAILLIVEQLNCGSLTGP